MTVSPAGAPAPRPHPHPAGPGRGSRGWLLGAFGLLSLVAATAVAWFAYRQTDSLGGAVLVLLCALLPIPVVVGSFLWIDRYEPEPSSWLAAAFAWGAVVAAGASLAVNTAVAQFTDLSFRWLATAVAPINEEITKALFLVLLFVWFRNRVDGVLDGVIYAGLVGVGFAFSENVLYYSGAYSGALTPDIDGPEATVGIFIVRGVFSPFTHSLFCIAFGIGIGLAASTSRRWLRRVAPPVGLLVSMGLHAAWNGSATTGAAAFFLVYGLLFLPAFVGGIAFAAVLRAQQGRVLITSLEDAARRGWLHVDEVPWMTRFGFKRRARTFASGIGGKPAKDAVVTYQRAVGRMGFAHDRVMRGRGGLHGVAAVAQQLQVMRAVRPRVVLPPPIRVRPPGVLHYGGAPYGWPPPSQPPRLAPDGRPPEAPDGHVSGRRSGPHEQQRAESDHTPVGDRRSPAQGIDKDSRR
ncbi:MAG: PrsW family intramembrane metalloprotease [Actinomycetota bacterium]|nr:PrsW family intramembrane metalloprotease [Actinomycetota bacterium]